MDTIIVTVMSGAITRVKVGGFQVQQPPILKVAPTRTSNINTIGSALTPSSTVPLSHDGLGGM